MSASASRNYPNISSSVSATSSNASVTSSAIKSGAPLDFFPLNTLSFGQSLTVLWFSPILITVWGIWGIIAFLCCQPSRWQKVPFACMMSSIFTLGPIILIASSVLFAFSVGLSDACATSTNVPYNFILSRGDALCGDIGGVGRASACSLSTSLRLSGNNLTNLYVNATIDVPNLFASIISACPKNGEPDSLRLAISSFADSLKTQFPRILSAVLDDVGVSSGLVLRPQVRALLLEASLAASDASAIFAGSLANGTLSCNTIGAVIREVKDSICCNLVTPFYWHSLMWFLSSWIVIFLGLPLAILARKRVPSRIWGRNAINTADRMEAIHELLAMQASSNLLLAGMGGDGKNEGGHKRGKILSSDSYVNTGGNAITSDEPIVIPVQQSPRPGTPGSKSARVAPTDVTVEVAPTPRKTVTIGPTTTVSHATND